MVGEKGEEETASGEYRKAKTSVWWDIENCQVPKSSEAHSLAQNITAALSKLDYGGSVSISAYGDTNRIPSNIQHALSSTGISLNHVPSGVKDASDKKILVDMLLWAVDNPAPANYLLISGDRDFANALHQLRMRRYNILLAHPPPPSSPVLVAAANTVWLWTTLLTASPPPLSPSHSPPPSNSTNINNVSNPRMPVQPPLLHLHLPLIPVSTPTKPPLKFKPTYVPNTSILQTIPISLAFPSPLSQTHHLSHSQPDESSNAFRTTPHQFFGPDHLVASAGSCAFPANLNPSASRSKSHFAPNHQNHFSYISRTTSSPDYSASVPRNVYPPPAHNHTFRPLQPISQPLSVPSTPPPPPSTSAPDIAKLSISERPTYIQISENLPQQAGREFKINPPKYSSSTNKNYPQRNTLNRQSSAPAHTSSPLPDPPHAQQGAGSISLPTKNEQLSLAGLVLIALDTLRNEMITPTEANIIDCIRFSVPGHRNTDAKKALEFAISRNLVHIQTVGKVEIYLLKNQPRVWPSINPIGGSPNEFQKATWDKVQEFLVSSSGRSAITASVCSYEAALILKNLCLQDLKMGKVICVLNMSINCKRWIKLHHTGWQPVIITLKRGDTGKADS